MTASPGRPDRAVPQITAQAYADGQLIPDTEELAVHKNPEN
jgi:hypothetical protein